MKAKLLLLTFLTVSISLSAQKIYLEGGYLNPYRYGAKTSDYYFDAVRLGVLYEHNLKYNFGIQTGALLNAGYSHKYQLYGQTPDSVDYTTRNFSLDIPAHLVYHQKLFWGISMFGYVGPTLQIGLFQPQTINSNLSEAYTQLTGITSGERDLYSYDQGVRRINLQLGTGGGFQWKKYILKGGFDWGINSLDRSGYDRVLQRNWHVSFVYQLK
jgi:hypothetical protein